MWDDGVTTDATTTPRPTIMGPAQAGTCATCARPAPPGKLRCDLCIEEEWNKLRLKMGEDWYERHAAYRRPSRDTSGAHDEP